ncbi:MAG TPA: zinc-ribbon domain-containing protein [bacterium]|nr:zinc-ribbon domain-containing protein [bacterium]
MKKTILIFLILFVTNSDLYSYHFNFDYKNIGTRSSALGGAYTSVIDKTNYNFINPAAIDFNNSLNINLTYRFPSNVKIYPVNYIKTKKENEIEFLNINYATEKFNCGIVYLQKFNWLIKTTLEAGFGSSVTSFEYKLREEIKKYSLPVSYKIFDNLSAGLEMSILEFLYKIDGRTVVNYDKNEKVFNIGMGLLYRLINSNIGFSIYKNNAVVFDVFDYFEQPLNINLGISHIFKINDKLDLLLSSDVSFEKWKYRNMKTIENSLGQYAGMSYEKINLTNFKCGSELSFNNNLFKHNFRLGFYTKKSPDNIYWDSIKENLLQGTIGYGIEINLKDYNNIYFDVSYEDTLNKALNREEVIKLSLAYNHKLGNNKKENLLFKSVISEDKKEQFKIKEKEKVILNSEKIIEESIQNIQPKKIDKSDIIYCHNCGFKLLSDSKFCSKCGAKIIE